jgi:hypothetical protein
MIDDYLDAQKISLSGRLEGDLWPFVAHAPPDFTVMRDLCWMAADLWVAELCTRQRGCHADQAEAFVIEAQNLSIGIERLGAHAANSVLAVMSGRADDFSIVMLDMLAGRE